MSIHFSIPALASVSELIMLSDSLLYLYQTHIQDQVEDYEIVNHQENLRVASQSLISLINYCQL